MGKKLLTGVLLSLLLICFTGSVSAWSGRADLEGRPEEFGAQGFYIWHDGRGIHIWTTARDQGHVYTGVIKTDGLFTNARGYRLETGAAYKADNQCWFEARLISGNHFSYGGREVYCASNKLRFKFDTATGADGINFNVKNASYIEFELYMDGKPAHRQMINLGDESWHPNSHDFKIYP